MNDILFVHRKLLNENKIQNYSCEIIRLYRNSTKFIYEETKKII